MPVLPARPQRGLGGPVLRPALLWIAFAVGSARSVSAAGGAPFDTAAEAVETPDGSEEGAVWDFSEPFWIFFAQERLLAPETPLGEAIPRMAFAHVRPAGENGRFFFVLAGIAYLGLYHHEIGSAEVEASLFTMLYPVGSPVYRDGREVLAEGYEATWTDASFRAMKTWGADTARRVRLGAEYQLASRQYHRTDETGAAFVLPGDTLVHEGDLVLDVDTRSRGRMGDFTRGWELEFGLAHEFRDGWNAWGAGGTEHDDPRAERAATIFGSFEVHATFGESVPVTMHAKLRGAQGFDLDRLTFLRLGGGGFGRQFDRVGAGSTGAANDGELFRMDGVPGYFGGEFLTDRYAQVNVELDLPAGRLSAFHLSAAWARLVDVQDDGRPWRDLLGFSLGYVRIFDFKSAVRLDLGYSPRPDGMFDDTGDVTFTYIKKF